MQLFCAIAKILLPHKKLKKSTLKNCSEKLKSTLLPLLPGLPKQPKEKNSCSTLQMFAGIYGGFIGKSECGDFKFTGITYYPQSL